MTFKEAVVKCIKDVRNYMGRARRSEFWYFLLFDSVVVSVVNIITAPADSADGTSTLGRMLSIVLLLPMLSVGSRRMHDIGKDGKLTFLQLIPIANLYFLYLCTKEGDPNANQYGPSPKAQNAQSYNPEIPVTFADVNPKTEEKEFSVNNRPNAVNISDHVNSVEIPREKEKDEIQQCVELKKKETEKKVCKVCGAQLEAGDNFCNVCGAKVE